MADIKFDPKVTVADHAFDSSEITALSHLYRGELYRSTVWRTRLDTTTNWAVATTGIALTVTFSSSTASPLPLVIVGLLVAVVLSTEARRYRFFDFWRIRTHVLELNFFGPILRGRGPRIDNGWNETLARDYEDPRLHITWLEAAGRRLRRTYGWIFLIQATSCAGKPLTPPTRTRGSEGLGPRAMIGPVPGQVVFAAGLVLCLRWAVIAFVT